MQSEIWMLLALAASLGSVVLCWKAWGSEGGGPLIAVATGFAALAMGLWIAGYGAEIGIPLALETAALIAFGFILTRMEVRPLREMRTRTVPPGPVRSRWKVSVVRTFGTLRGVN
jgi:hypothetical protein